MNNKKSLFYFVGIEKYEYPIIEIDNTYVQKKYWVKNRHGVVVSITKIKYKENLEENLKIFLNKNKEIRKEIFCELHELRIAFNLLKKFKYLEQQLMDIQLKIKQLRYMIKKENKDNNIIMNNISFIRRELIYLKNK